MTLHLACEVGAVVLLDPEELERAFVELGFRARSAARERAIIERLNRSPARSRPPDPMCRSTATWASAAARLVSLLALRSAISGASLRRYPWRGTRRDEISAGLRATPSAGKGVIAFEVREHARTVRILSIAWGGFDWLGRVTSRAQDRDT